MGYTWQGISSIIRGAKNNLKTYQGQELTEDLGLGVHEWRYRISDPQLGRFWQIDPLAEKYDYNSVFAFQENKFGIGTELEGKEVREWLNNAAEGFKRVFVKPIQDANKRQAKKQSMYRGSDRRGPTKNITGNYFGDALYKLGNGDTFKRAVNGDKKAQFRVISGTMLALQPGSRAKITTKTTTKAVKNSAQKLADKAQKLSSKNRPNTVAVLETKDGRMIVGRNQGNTQNAQTQADIEGVGINEFCGQCAEVNAVARAKNKGYDVEGATISVSNVRGENSTTGVHGTNKAPCSTCSGLLEKNNITVEQ
jgi:RHS repeat-associated protein